MCMSVYIYVYILIQSKCQLKALDDYTLVKLHLLNHHNVSLQGVGGA